MWHRNGEPKRGGLIRMGVRGIAGGVGLISESIKAHKDGKGKEEAAATQDSEPASRGDSEVDGSKPVPDIEQPDDAPPSYAEASGSNFGQDQYPADDKTGHLEALQLNEVVVHADSLEEEWELDDAQDQIVGESQDKDEIKDTEKIADRFIRNHPAPAHAQRGALALPVVIPQRRPKDRARGFVRAYAPVLENAGIDQATWLAFLEAFQKSSAVNPWLNAINMAQFATFAIHGFGIGLAVGYAISKVADAAIEMESRRKTNNFLQKINAEFFQPRGLYCLVMTWNPQSSHRSEQVNITHTIASRSSPSTGASAITSKFRSSDGPTTEFDFPEVAPLVFPVLDHLAAQTSADGVQKKSKIASSMAFVGDYWDRRATAEYSKKNPNSLLAQVPQPEFKSRYADPKKPAASGSLIAFVSGGHLVPEPQSRGLIGGIISVVGQAVRGEKQGQAWENMPPTNNVQYANRYGRGTRGRVGIVSTPVGLAKKVLKQNVLYLLVVNMPTEEEMAEGTRAY